MVRAGRNFSIQKYVFLVIIFFSSLQLFAQHRIPSGYCMTKEEQQLAEAINKIRIEHGKSPVKLSVSLSYVAKTHVKDLEVNHPDTSVCNLSSWSNKGKWTPVCFNPYVVDQKAMWDKPRQLTRYPYNGYELAGYMQDGIIVDSLADLWDTLWQSLNMILTEGSWSKKSWRAMGVGIEGNYASVWFGQREDKEGEPRLCHRSRHETRKEKAEEKKIHQKEFYYLIVGSFPNMDDAREVVRRLKKNGFKNAGIMANPNKYRVYFDRYENYKEALKAKKKLPYNYKKTWILKD